MQTPSIAGACLLGWKKEQEDPNRRRDKQLPSFLLIFYPPSVLRSITLPPPPSKTFSFFPRRKENPSASVGGLGISLTDLLSSSEGRKKALFTPCRVRSRAKIIDADSLRPEAKDVPLSDRA